MTTTTDTAATGTDTGTEGTQDATKGTDGTTDTSTTDEAATAEEVAKWKALARKHEDRAKANEAAKKELEKLQAASMTDQQKAIAEAAAKARAEALAEVGSSLVDAEFKVAAAGLSLDVPTLLESLDRSKFIGDDGKPDAQRIGEWVNKLAPKSETKRTATDTGQGTRPAGNGVAQIKSRAELQKMTPEQIATAYKEGRVSELLAGS